MGNNSVVVDPALAMMIHAVKIPASSIFSEATKSLTIIVPAFNEEKRLPSTLDETLRYARCACEGLLSGLRPFIPTGLRHKLG